MKLMQEYLGRELERYKQDLEASIRGECLLQQLDLLDDVERYATEGNANLSTQWIGGKYTPTDRVDIVLRIPAKDIEAMRPALHDALATVGEWTKDHYIQATFHSESYQTELIECWTAQFEKLPQTAACAWPAQNRIEIQFHQQAVAGMEVGDNGCTIGQVENVREAQERHVSTRLAVVCSTNG